MDQKQKINEIHKDTVDGLSMFISASTAIKCDKNRTSSCLVSAGFIIIVNYDYFQHFNQLYFNFIYISIFNFNHSHNHRHFFYRVNASMQPTKHQSFYILSVFLRLPIHSPHDRPRSTTKQTENSCTRRRKNNETEQRRLYHILPTCSIKNTRRVSDDAPNRPDAQQQ